MTVRSLLTSACLALYAVGFARADGALPPVVGKARTVEVSAGDSLYELGLKYNLAIEHFAFANHIPVSLTVGSSRELTVPSRRILPSNPPRDGLVVNLPERGVYLFRDGVFQKFYPVAIGQPGRFATPIGEFKLVSRVKDPTWMPPAWAGLGEETIVPAGPENPLGDRWMGLSMPGLGLHSTTQPSSIGQAASHGCMRMYPHTARELFDKVRVGDSVRIEYETVRLGRDPDDGSLCMSVFPDVYNQKPLAARAQELLAAQGLGSLLPAEGLAGFVKDPEGLPKPLADGNVALSVDGQANREPGLLLKAPSGVWLSVEALRRAGVTAAYDGTTKSVARTFKEQNATYSTSDGALIDGRLFLPARTVLQALGIGFHWDGANKSLTID